MGKSQVEPHYFRLEVLQKYFDQQDKFKCTDNIIGGYIYTRDQYYLRLPADERDAKTFGKISYGKRKLSDGGEAIFVILWDLAQLPDDEQVYWQAHEIPQPRFAKEDPNFYAFFRREFYAESVKYHDPIEECYRWMAFINKLFKGEKLFSSVVRNPDLKYPVYNTYDAYSQAHMELEKVVISRLNKDLIIELLSEQKLDKVKDGGSLKQLERLLTETAGESFADRITQPLFKCLDNRKVKAHKIDPKELPSEDLISTFRNDVEGMVQALVALYLYLCSLPSTYVCEQRDI
jgi:hypothetical protein